MNPILLCQGLSCPIWLTDPRGTVIFTGQAACPASVGKNFFKGNLPQERFGLASVQSAGTAPLRYYFRRTEQGYLCLALPYLQMMPDPFGVRRDRVTEILTDLTVLLKRLCLHLRFAETEWLTYFEDPTAFPSIRRILSKLPAHLDGKTANLLLSRSICPSGEDPNLPRAEWIGTISEKQETKAVFESYLLLCSLFLLLRRLDTEKAVFTVQPAGVQSKLHVRALLAEPSPILKDRLDAIRVSAEFGLRHMRIRYHVEGRIVQVELHSPLPPSSVLFWNWSEVEDSALRQLYDALLLIRDGLRALCNQEHLASLGEERIPSGIGL